MLQLDYPSDEFIAQFAKDHKLTAADVLRDIARLVAVHQMTVETKFLNDDCVLCGGVAMRFYGSRRFTVTDTDASYRLDDSVRGTGIHGDRRPCGGDRRVQRARVGRQARYPRDHRLSRTLKRIGKPHLDTQAARG